MHLCYITCGKDTEPIAIQINGSNKSKHVHFIVKRVIGYVCTPLLLYSFYFPIVRMIQFKWNEMKSMELNKLVQLHRSAIVIYFIVSMNANPWKILDFNCLIERKKRHTHTHSTINDERRQLGSLFHKCDDVACVDED